MAREGRPLALRGAPARGWRAAVLGRILVRPTDTQRAAARGSPGTRKGEPSG